MFKYGSPKWASLLAAVDKLHMVVAGEKESNLDDMVSFLHDREKRLRALERIEQAKHPYSLKNEDQQWAPNPKLDLSKGVDDEQLESAAASLNNTGRATIARFKRDQKIDLHFAHTIPRRTYEHEKNATQQRLYREDPRGLSEGEGASILAVHEYCRAENKAGRKAFVFYFHNKGGCCKKPSKVIGNVAVAEWREALNTFNLEFPSICLRALLSGYTTCGYGLQDRHYSGNYWWADCAHVARLPSPPIFYPWWLEFYALNTSLSQSVANEYYQHCAHGPHNCRVNHYATSCPRSSYLPIIKSYLANGDVPQYDSTRPFKTKNGQISSEFIRKRVQGSDMPRFEACRAMLRAIPPNQGYVDLPYFDKRSSTSWFRDMYYVTVIGSFLLCICFYFCNCIMVKIFYDKHIHLEVQTTTNNSC